MNKKQHFFSFSQLGTYSNCPQKYKLIYIDKKSKPYDSIEAFMGKVVHEVLEWLYNDKVNCGFDEINKKYDEIWHERWHDNIFIAEIKKQHDTKFFKKIGLECLRHYYRLNGEANIDYSKTIGVEKKIEFQIDSFYFKTVIDRLDDKDGIFEIHDYKAGKPKTKKMLKKDLQLFIYLKAVESHYTKSHEKITLNWHYLKERTKDKQHIQIIKTDAELNEHKKELLNQVKRINDAKGTGLFPAKESFLCQWCYFWDECEGMPEQYYRNKPSIRAKQII